MKSINLVKTKTVFFSNFFIVLLFCSHSTNVLAECDLWEPAAHFHEQGLKEYNKAVSWYSQAFDEVDRKKHCQLVNFATSALYGVEKVLVGCTVGFYQVTLHCKEGEVNFKQAKKIKRSANGIYKIQLVFEKERKLITIAIV